jgi:hypothetical protein
MLAIFAWPGLSGSIARAADDGEEPSACVRTAFRMFAACRLDIGDDYKVTGANCINISDKAERIACREEAIATRDEEEEQCAAQRDARVEVCELLGENRYDPDPLLDPTVTFVDPNHIDKNHANPYVSLVAGHTFVLRAGETFQETVVVHVTDKTREIQGVHCRVVVDIVFEAQEENGILEYVPLEVTDDWFAQDVNRNVYYCGELARNFEDGLLNNLDGSFEAGKAFAKAGTLIRALPAVGDAHRQEFALGEAEDIIQYVSLNAVPTDEEGGENPSFSCAKADGCLKALERAALEPEVSEFKYYLPGIGLVLAVSLEDGNLTGEREELVCVGDSLEILKHASCGIQDPKKLRDKLCELSPGVFCQQG